MPKPSISIIEHVKGCEELYKEEPSGENKELLGWARVQLWFSQEEVADIFARLDKIIVDGKLDKFKVKELFDYKQSILGRK